jgi:flagellar motor switch protein FliN/FliY
MAVDQSEIDALLSEADHLVSEAAEEATSPVETAPEQASPTSDQAGPAAKPPSPELARILRVRVPVIARLAERRMTVSNVRGLSCGNIIEFDKSVDEPLDLLIRNRLVGRGIAVKVGENFGLRVLEVEDKEQRIRSMGR